MSLREGPIICRPQPYNTCLGCRWLVRRMVASGRDPIYDHLCTHTRSGGLLGSRHIGRDDKTPDWCPVPSPPEVRP